MIITIGGGEINTGETRKIDQFIVDAAKKENPKLLFIPTASNDAPGYIDTVKSVYENLGCTVNSLCLVSSKYKDSVIEDLIMSADIIYIGGGNTKKMMKVWKKYKVDQYLIEAYKKGVIMSGLSAGAICWFKVGHSDSEFIEGKKDADHIIVEGLGLIPYAVCPHYNEPERKSFDKMVKDLPFASIALEDNTALVYENNDFRIIRSDNTKDAYIFIGGLKTKLTAIDL